MPLESPEPGISWVSVPLDSSLECTVIGEPHTWHTHWYSGPQSRHRLAVRCLLDELGACEWCRHGYDRRTRYVLPVRVGDTTRVIEMGRVQYPALAAAEAFGGLIGCVLICTRERPTRNAPIVVRVARREHVSAECIVDIQGFVNSLGRTEARALDPTTGTTPPATPSTTRTRR